MRTMTNTNTSKRYYLSIKTAPGQQWQQPTGWERDSLDDAREMLVEASKLWLAARVTDAQTGQEVAP